MSILIVHPDRKTQRTVQRILGQDRFQTTAIYLNFTNTPIQEEFERKW